MTIRTLILSGGGGRGAFHAGVYKYLSETHKEKVDATHSAAWEPDIIVGTSIGAVNGAAIAQGTSAAELERIWLALREHDIEGLPPGMRSLTRFVVNRVMRSIIGTKLEVVPKAQARSPSADESWPALPVLPKSLSERLIGRWNNLLDTGPLEQTLIHKMRIDPDKLAASKTTLIITATNVQTGEQVTFSNRPIHCRKTGNARADVRVGITINRIIASCSVPLVYPWTKDGDDYYWDGAVVANTPLGASLDVASELSRDRVPTEPMEVLVVMMTPWWEEGEDIPRGRAKMPGDFGEAITWTLDWALLASFRSRLHTTRMCNKLGLEQAHEGRPITYRQVEVKVIAPKDFMPVARIIDYDEVSSELIRQGYNAARDVFQRDFGG